MMRAIIFISLSLAVAACNAPPIKEEETNNEQVQVDLLFENDGCKVYRFEDGWRKHYYTDCRGSTITTETRHCGKNCFQQLESENSSTGKGEE